MPFFNSPFPSGIFQLIKVTYRLIVHYPLHAISLILLSQTGRNTTYGSTPVLAAYNQCPVSHYKMTFEMNCYPIDELYQYYHVIKNVDSLQDVQYFLFGEHHKNQTHLQLKGSFTKKLGGAGDLVLFEGIDSSMALQCSSVGYHSGPDYHLDYRPLSDPIDISTPEKINSDREAGIIRWWLGDRFFCRGWDNAHVHDIYRPRMIFVDNILQHAQRLLNEYDRIWDNLNEIGLSLSPPDTSYLMDIIHYLFSSLHDYKRVSFIANLYALDDVLTLQEAVHSLFNTITYQTYFNSVAKFKYEPIALKQDLSNTLESLIHMHEQLALFIIDFKTEIKVHTDESKIVYEYIISVRNEEAEDTFNRWKAIKNEDIKSVYALKKGRNLFSFFGTRHLITDDMCQSDECFAVEPGSLQYQFRKSLSDKPHVILIPKM
jgi:hypothetical protein